MLSTSMNEHLGNGQACEMVKLSEPFVLFAVELLDLP
jgi:hypothetical protein